MKAVDLFCGCGGTTEGIKSAGFCVLGAVDIEPTPLKTYRENHPEVTVWEADIRELKPEDMLQRFGLDTGDLDLLAGCPPCQGFSRIRTCNKVTHVDDPRNDLILEFLRFVEGLRPRAVMVENVPGAAKYDGFIAFTEKMKSLGYVGGHRILNAADYGVPQRRHRMIYLAGLGGEIPFPDKIAETKTVWDAIGSLPRAGESGDPAHDVTENRSPRVMEIIRHTPKDGGSHQDIPENLRIKRPGAFKNNYGRLAWKKVAQTITGECLSPSSGGRVLHPEEDRAITPREAALLQGFPRDYVFATTSKTAMAKMIGNAVPPPLAKAVCESVRAWLQENPK